MKNNVIKNKSYKFALRIIKMFQYLQKEKNEYVLSKQILRSGTAIGALIEEGDQAESKADFIHKLSIANKEANETHYWIRLLIDSQIIDENAGKSILTDCEELLKLLTSIIKTAKNNQKVNKQ